MERDQQKRSKFMQQKGFYMVLVVCVCVVIASATIVVRRNKEALNQMNQGQDEVVDLDHSFGYEDSLNDIAKAQQKLEDPKEIKVESAESKNEQSAKPKEESKQQGKNDVVVVQKDTALEELRDDGPKVTAFSKVEKMSQPVQGKVIKQFGDELSDVTGTWSYNSGIDIEAKAGSQVKAALAGVVEKVDQNEMKGISIIVDHGDGLKTEYSNLSTKDLVKPGMKVQKGQVISGVSKDYALGAFTDKEHVHFAVVEDGTYIDPKTRLE